MRRTKPTLIYRRTGNYVPSNFCSGIKKVRARCDTWAWRWTTLWRSQKSSRSVIPGQSCHALPTPRRGESVPGADMTRGKYVRASNL